MTGGPGAPRTPQTIPQTIQFGPFRLDLRRAQLLRGNTVIRLRQKTLGLLVYLAKRPQQLVTKGDLLAALWPGTHVGEAVLAVSVSELRQGLGDSSQRPRFIETVHRRGYRWLAPRMSRSTAQPTQPNASVGRARAPKGSSSAPSAGSRDAVFVDRNAEIASLDAHLRRSMLGQRQIVLVNGDIGLGKTTLLRKWLETSRVIKRAGRLTIGRGQCLEQHGPGEPFMPVLDALSRLCARPAQQRLRAVIRDLAPSWVPLLPIKSGQARTTDDEPAINRKRMIREMVVALEALAADQPFILLLKDLHWSDVSTIELLGALGKHQEAARLLVVGTYRPLDAMVTSHPLTALKYDLMSRGAWDEVVLKPLTLEAERAYLLARGVPVAARRNLLHAVHALTQGNPLFLALITEQLIDSGFRSRQSASASVELSAILKDTPSTLRGMIQHHLDELSDRERGALDAASVVGFEFTLAAVAAALGADLAQTEWIFSRPTFLKRFVTANGTQRWPDGTSSSSFRFAHPFSRELVYSLLAPATRRGWHARIGRRLEAAYAREPNAIAGAVALHLKAARTSLMAGPTPAARAPLARGEAVCH